MTLVVESVTCHRGRSLVLADISLTLQPGRLTVLVGPNGAGKSTLLAAMSGDIKPTSGRVLLDNRDLHDWHPHDLARQRAVLLQSNNVSFGFTTREVVMMGRHPWTRTSTADEDDAVVDDALDQLEVRHLAERPVRTLSGGERARVGLARVLAQTTDVVLLDEPTAALDLRHQEDVMHRARLLTRDGHTVAVVLHDLALAAAYADEVAILDGGRLVTHGPPDDVLTGETIRHVYGVAVDRVETPDGRTAFIPHRPHLRKETT